MQPEWHLEAGAVVLRFHASTWRVRLARYGRGLVGARSLAFVGLLALPAIVVGAIFGFRDGLTAFSAALGAGLVTLVVIAGALATLAQPIRTRTVSFDDDGVREEVGGKVKERTWAWIEAVAFDGKSLEIHVKKEPIESLRLAPASPTVLLVDRAQVDPPIFERLAALLEKHAR